MTARNRRPGQWRRVNETLVQRETDTTRSDLNRYARRIDRCMRMLEQARRLEGHLGLQALRERKMRQIGAVYREIESAAQLLIEGNRA